MAWIAVSLAGSVATPAAAQATNPSDESLRQLERQQELRDRLESSPDVRLPRPSRPAPAIPANETPCVDIDRIRLVGEPRPRFERALRRALGALGWQAGQCLGKHGIRAILRETQQQLIDLGLITTRVSAPPQDLDTRELHLSILPGRVGVLRSSDASSPRARLDTPFPTHSGDLLDLRDLEQGLENLERLPSVTAEIDIQPGTAPGESDVVVGWQQDFPLRVLLSIDDSGSRETGRFLGTATVFGDHLVGLNGLLYASLTRNLGLDESTRPGRTRSYTLHYSAPFGYWRFGATASRFEYDQTIAGLNRDYRYSGKGERREAEISRVVHRSDVGRTRLKATAWLQTYSNAIDETRIAVQDRRMAGYTAGIEHRHFLGRATLDLALSHRWGTGMLGATTAPEEAFGEGTARPHITSFHARLDAPFVLAEQPLRYRGQIRGQFNHTRLIPQDRFAIGSRHSVRGFGGNLLLSGERGLYWRNEVHLELPGPLHPYLALDTGRVDGPSTDDLPGRHLVGAAVGLQWRWKNTWIDAWAARAMDRPAAYPDPGLQAGFQAGIHF
ncbi:ShlB/FhaC/HecB family hemolysin secretion/activation protein [Guyparkeria halophila]|uniref:ShlB/FhaC/HecB family hemolysin secretion/activation protein n=1 Tax=Guyparkeria halophila TaxID=47960 RepID=A0A6I6D0N1_9GAMM|nr:ShlB/FhaC/HecB family hemolysin secretion/activation protein [Guyparkeria halophila]QGT79270.1 ShlB/FhaC/HecB family hemolysin secretion/activation protein [Guyparkeria halophila]